MSLRTDILEILSCMLLLASCSMHDLDSVMEQDDGLGSVSDKVILQLQIADNTRSGIYGLQNGEFDSRTKIGLFVVRPEIWEQISSAAANDSIAPAYCDSKYNGYGLFNLKCHVSNGYLVADDGSGLSIPSDKVQDSVGLAIVAYAPYKADLKLRSLLARHGGTNLQLNADQSKVINELNSDIILGLPREGNPIWRLSAIIKDSLSGEVYDDSIYIRHSYRVNMDFSHYATRISLNTCFQNTTSADTLSFDSIRVSLVNPVLIYRYGPYLDHSASAFTYPDEFSLSDLNTDDVIMSVCRPTGTLLPGQTSSSYYSTCIVLPMEIHQGSTQFRYEFFKDGKKVIADKTGTVQSAPYQPGKSFTFDATVKISETDLK